MGVKTSRLGNLLSYGDYASSASGIIMSPIPYEIKIKHVLLCG
jgi:hypothetical protein